MHGHSLRGHEDAAPHIAYRQEQVQKTYQEANQNRSDIGLMVGALVALLAFLLV